MSTAKKHNEDGEGSVYQRSSDGLWVGTVEAGWTASGARRRIPVYGKTEAIARRKLRDRKLEIERDGNTSVSQRATVKSWAEQWLPIVERDLSPSAYNATKSAINRWIVPTIGHRRFNMLTPADVRAVATAQRSAGRTSSTQARTRGALPSRSASEGVQADLGDLKAGRLVPRRLEVRRAVLVEIV